MNFQNGKSYKMGNNTTHPKSENTDDEKVIKHLYTGFVCKSVSMSSDVAEVLFGGKQFGCLHVVSIKKRRCVGELQSPGFNI